MKNSITRKEYLALLGLILVAKKHIAVVDSCIGSVGEIIGEDEPSGGHSSDLAYGERDLDEWLRIQKIEVTE